MIVRLSGGLGNQLFQYAFGKAISTKRGEKLYLDILAFSRDPQREYALSDYAISMKKPGLKGLFYNFWFYLNRKTRFISRGQVNKGIYFEKEEFLFEENFPRKAEFFEGCWQNVRYFESIRGELLEELTYQKELSQEKKQNLDMIKKINNSVAVHVRHGDYLSQKNQTIYEVPTIDYYKRAMEYLKGVYPDCKFIFFSDDIEWCKDKFGDEADCVFINQKQPNTAQEDLLFIQSCKNYIIANSSFSWWASWLGKNNQSVCVAPQRWYKDKRWNESVKEALLKDFVLIEN